MVFLAALPPGFLLFLVVAVVGAIVVSAKRHLRMLDEAWTTAAADLDLSYSTRKASGATQRKLVGHFERLPVKVSTFTEGSGKSKKTYTRYQMRYPGLGLGLELTQQHFFSGLKNALTGRQDIQIGSKEFDDAVIVPCGSSQEVIEYLTRDRQLALQRFLTSKRRAEVTDDEASFISKGVVAEPTKIRRALETLHELTMSIGREPVPASERDHRPLDDRPPEPAIDLPLGSPIPEPDPAPAGEAHRESEDPLDQPLGDPLALPGELPTHEPPPSISTPEPTPEPAPVEPPEASDPRPEPADLAHELGTGVPPDSSSLDAPAEPAPTPPPATSLEYTAVCADLFQSDRMSYETKDHFEATYAGSEVRWTGKLERLSSYSSDLVFQGSGVKATIGLEPYMDGSFEKDVEAIVQLPDGTDADLKEYVGSDVVLTGRLLSCDGFMRKLMIVDGMLEQA